MRCPCAILVDAIVELEVEVEVAIIPPQTSGDKMFRPLLRLFIGIFLLEAAVNRVRVRVELVIIISSVVNLKKLASAHDFDFDFNFSLFTRDVNIKVPICRSIELLFLVLPSILRP